MKRGCSYLKPQRYEMDVWGVKGRTCMQLVPPAVNISLYKRLASTPVFSLEGVTYVAR